MRKVTMIAVITGLLLGATVIAAAAQDYNRNNQTSGGNQTDGRNYGEQNAQSQPGHYNRHGQYERNRHYDGGPGAQDQSGGAAQSDRQARQRADARRGRAYRRLAYRYDNPFLDAYGRALEGDTQAYAFERHEIPVAGAPPIAFSED